MSECCLWQHVRITEHGDIEEDNDGDLFELQSFT